MPLEPFVVTLVIESRKLNDPIGLTGRRQDVVMTLVDELDV